MLPERLTTRRLLLRRPRATDAPSILSEYAQDPEVTRYMEWRAHASLENTRAFLAWCEQERAAGREVSWVITARATDHAPASDRAIGMIALHMSGHKASLGYVLARRQWRLGLMTEAAQAVLVAAFADPAVYRVWATCDVANTGSARLLEKLGMHREGVLRRWALHPNVSPEPRDSLSYAITRDDLPTKR
jgi:[ribosomal protein S5]-alanine N-acetyltransferase